MSRTLLLGSVNADSKSSSAANLHRICLLRGCPRMASVSKRVREEQWSLPTVLFTASDGCGVCCTTFDQTSFTATTSYRIRSTRYSRVPDHSWQQPGAQTYLFPDVRGSSEDASSPIVRIC